MKTSELINLDWTDDDNRYILVTALQKIPPLAKMNASAIDSVHVEKAIHIMCYKYGFHIRINQDAQANKKYDVWNCQLYNDKDLKIVSRVYGMCMDEVLIKTAIVLYSQVRRVKR